MDQGIAFIAWADGSLRAPGLLTVEKKLGDLQSLFADQDACRKLDAGTVLYRVWWWEPVPAGTEGGLFWGRTEILPGKVGSEYFMTRGHWHSRRNRAEFYGTVAGSGSLLLQEEDGTVRLEEMSPGTLHYIHGNVAHRVINTGDSPLRFVACWPSDAGHDYNVGNGRGFGARILERNGRPVLVTGAEADEKQL